MGIESKTSVGGFPIANETIETGTTTASLETAEKPVVTAYSAVPPEDFKWTAVVGVTLSTDWAKPLRSLVGNTFTGSIVARVGLYDQDARKYIDASQFGFTTDLTTMLALPGVSSVRYLGESSLYSFYRLILTGILETLPPATLSFGCGALKSKELTSTSMICYIDFNFAGAFVGSAVVVQAESSSLRSLRPECTPTMRGPDGVPIMPLDSQGFVML